VANKQTNKQRLKSEQPRQPSEPGFFYPRAEPCAGEHVWIDGARTYVSVFHGNPGEMVIAERCKYCDTSRETCREPLPTSA
jgi:hypothetical protein